MSFAAQFLLIYALMVVQDMVWQATTRPYYDTVLGDMMKPNYNLVALLIYYFIYSTGLLGLVIFPYQHFFDKKYFLLSAIAYGLISQGSYALINMTQLRRWRWSLVALEITWMTVCTVLIAMVVRSIS